MRKLVSVCLVLLLTVSVFAQRPSEINILQTDDKIAIIASSTNKFFSTFRTVNADRTGANWGGPSVANSGWEQTPNEHFGFPTLTYSLGRIYKIKEVTLIGRQDDEHGSIEPVDTMTSPFANPHVVLEGSLDCTNYTVLDDISGNNKVIMRFNGQGFLASCIRLTFDTALAFEGRATVAEVAVWASQ